MLSPVIAVEVSVPTRSSWLESAKTFSDVDLLRLGRLRRDAEQRRVRSPGSRIACRSERSTAVVPPSTASGPRMSAQQVRPLREALDVLAAGREHEQRVGDQRDRDRLVPVRGVNVTTRGPLRDRDRRRDGRRRSAAAATTVSLSSLPGADPLIDWILYSVGVERADLDQLALEEAVVEPARAVGPRQRPRDRIPLDRPGEDAARDEARDDGAREAARGRRRRERQRLPGDRRDDEVGGRRAGRDPDQLAGGEALVEEAPERRRAGRCVTTSPAIVMSPRNCCSAVRPPIAASAMPAADARRRSGRR